jgi:CRP-like cAMP-binding protein
VIIYQDDIGREMFIVRKGQVEVLKPSEKLIQSDKQFKPILLSKERLLKDGSMVKDRIILKDGDFFGETALVAEVRRTNTVIAITICDLNVLNKTVRTL